MVRNPDSAHPDANSTWGNAYTIVQLELIANIYRQQTGNQLSINDMSLPEGGLFDIFAVTPDISGQLHTWQPPHKGHRLGFAFDVNSTDAGQQPVPCKKGYLRNSVEEFDISIGIDATTIPTQIVCESQNRIHINAVDSSTLSLAAQ